MKKSRLFAALTAAMLFAAAPLQVAAAEVPTDEEASTYATGLIAEYTINAYYGYNTLMVDASTYASGEMAKIGLVNMVVQYSDDKITWMDEVYLDDMINQNAYYFSVYGYGVPVLSGHYYRIVITFYAKEKGWFFPGSQSITVPSKSVWIG